MNLKEYLKLNKIKIQKLADDTDFQRSHLSKVVNGRLKPHAKTARALSKYTNGVVSVDEILNYYKERTDSES